jgi:hypothetical protein
MKAGTRALNLSLSVLLVTLTGCESYWFDSISRGPVLLADTHSIPQNPSLIDTKEILSPSRDLRRSSSDLWPEIQITDGIQSGQRIAFFDSTRKKLRVSTVWKVFRMGPADTEEWKKAIETLAPLSNSDLSAPGILVTQGGKMNSKGLIGYDILSTQEAYGEVAEALGVQSGQVLCLSGNQSKVKVLTVFKRNEVIKLEVEKLGIATTLSYVSGSRSWVLDLKDLTFCH